MKQNRNQRRKTKAIAKRIKNRPGTGLTKRSAAKAKSPRLHAYKRVVMEMHQSEYVSDAVNSGKIDEYLK